MRETNEHSAQLRRLQSVWEAHAQDDPLWAIISIPGKKGGRWDLQEFLQTGVQEIARVRETLTGHAIEVSPVCALDFGCGVGRLSQAMCDHFDRVIGVDISPTMIQTAQKLNQYPERCRYLLNAEEDLRLFEDGTFTFIYSNVVLQHMEPNIAKKYLADFVRILRPGGLLVFQLPSSYQEEEGLPADAWRASLECDQHHFSWDVRTRKTLTIRVTNLGDSVWQSTGQRLLMLGNHWLDENGRMLRQDDGRVLVPEGLAPGHMVQLTLELETPPKPGRYLLELDLVQEGVAWFKNKGSTSLRLPVEILQASDKPQPTDQGGPAGTGDQLTSDPQVFEGFSMHCMPRREVIELLSHSGCRLEYIEPSDSGGPGYRGYLYFARKNQALP